MRTQVKNPAPPANSEKLSPMKESSPRGGATEEEVWEVRPGGMLVQKRTPDSDAPVGAPVPAIRVKVKYAGVYHEVYISSQASFGKTSIRFRFNQLHRDSFGTVLFGEKDVNFFRVDCELVLDLSQIVSKI